MGILDNILGRREPSIEYRTIDGGHPAPYPDMTDEQLYNYEIAFNVPNRTFDKPPRTTAKHGSRGMENTGLRETAPLDSHVIHTLPSGTKLRPKDEAFSSSKHTINREPEPLAHEAPMATATSTSAAEATATSASAAESGLQMERKTVTRSEMPPLDLTRPVRTITTKQPVEIITTRARHPVYKVHGYIDDDDVVTVFTLDGQLSENGPRFLENVPQKQELHLNVYPNRETGAKERYILTQHESREDADSSATAGRITCIKVEFDL